MPGRKILLAGTTAVGKSAVAIALARLVEGEIISVDSMQVYRGMDIGTAKISTEQRQGIPHHLIDVRDPHESFSAAEFVTLARTISEQIVSRGRVPILCGGTGLYFQALSEGLAEIPPSDPALRAELESMPLPVLLEELALRDPVAYERIDRSNPRRVVRAIEVIRLTQRPFSELRRDWSAEPGGSSQSQRAGERLIVLSRDPKSLVRRMDARVDEMFRSGLVEETQRLMGLGLRENRTAMQAIGYRQVVDYLEGRCDRESTIKEVKTRTRQYAKRQRAWFRNQAHGEDLPVSEEESPESTAERVLERVAAWTQTPNL